MKKVKELMGYAALFIVGLLIAVFINLFISFGIIDGLSMRPTFDSGNRYLLNKTKIDDVKRGDIIVFKNEITRSDGFIKRVIAVGGDVIEFSGKDVIVNGEVLTENYITPMINNYEEVIIEVPEGEVFVMGDNRPNSNDSRAFGCIKVEDINGVVIR